MLFAPLARIPLCYPQLMGGHIARWTRQALKGCLGYSGAGRGRVTLWEWGTRSGWGDICTPPDTSKEFAIISIIEGSRER
jgi:hypothetical protein